MLILIKINRQGYPKLALGALNYLGPGKVRWVSALIGVLASSLRGTLGMASSIH